jgi:hypothetical protein
MCSCSRDCNRSSTTSRPWSVPNPSWEISGEGATSAVQITVRVGTVLPFSSFTWSAVTPATAADMRTSTPSSCSRARARAASRRGNSPSTLGAASTTVHLTTFGSIPGCGSSGVGANLRPFDATASPVNPRPTTTNEPCASRVDPFGAMAASSSWPRSRSRRYRASASVLKPCACSSTPAMPNVLVTDPGFSTRRCHPSSCSRPSAPRTRHVCSAGSTAATAPVSTRVERSDAASGIAACCGSSTPPATSGSSGRYSMWSAGSTRTISSWPANLRSSARAQWNPVNPAATTTTRGRPELLLSLVAAARVAITGDLLLRGQVRGHDGGRPPSSSGQRCGRSRLPRRRVQAQLRAGWFHRRPPCGRSPTLCRSRCAG